MVAALAIVSLAPAACDSVVPSPATTEALLELPTTTADAPSRLEELETRLKQLNVDLLIAIFDEDPAALTAIHGSQSFYDEDVATIASRRMGLTARPDIDVITYEIVELLVDRADCVVALTRIDLTSVFNLEETEEQVEVMWQEPGGPLLLGAILPADAVESAWLTQCDESPRGVEP